MTPRLYLALLIEVLISRIKLTESKKQRLVDLSPASAKRVETVGRITTERPIAVLGKLTTFTGPLFALCFCYNVLSAFVPNAFSLAPSFARNPQNLLARSRVM